jgi:hypothetical protein
MTQAATMELDALRRGLTAPQRAFVDALWAFYRDHSQWVPTRLLRQHFGKDAMQTHCAALGESVVRRYREAGKEYYRLTFLGVLLAGGGEESEDLLVRYLGYIRDRYRADPRVEWVTSQEVEAALALRAEQSRLLRQLLRLSHWWGGGSGFGDREWTVGIPVDVDALLEESDLARYVREHVLRHFPVGVSAATGPAAGGEPIGPFWFVKEPGLRERLAADWHEAQDVCHVLGWKSCVILCGGILEALLTDALEPTGARAGRARRALAGLFAAAVERGLLTPESPRLGPALASFASLIHAGHRTRKIAEITRTDAEAALETVRASLRQLAEVTPNPPRPAGR